MFNHRVIKLAITEEAPTYCQQLLLLSAVALYQICEITNYFTWHLQFASTLLRYVWQYGDVIIFLADETLKTDMNGAFVFSERTWLKLVKVSSSESKTAPCCVSPPSPAVSILWAPAAGRPWLLPQWHQHKSTLPVPFSCMWPAQTHCCVDESAFVVV